jgi:hypothetical protein
MAPIAQSLCGQRIKPYAPITPGVMVRAVQPLRVLGMLSVAPFASPPGPLADALGKPDVRLCALNPCHLKVAMPLQPLLKLVHFQWL